MAFHIVCGFYRLPTTSSRIQILAIHGCLVVVVNSRPLLDAPPWFAPVVSPLAPSDP